jgi:hypothetical protein
MEHHLSATKMLALPLYHSWSPPPETAQNIPMRSISISKKYQTIGLKIITKKTNFSVSILKHERNTSNAYHQIRQVRIPGKYT